MKLNVMEIKTNPSAGLTAMPNNLQDAVKHLVGILADETKEKIIEFKAGGLVALHHSLGQFIRNEFRLWGGNKKLLENCFMYAEITGTELTEDSGIDNPHPDDMSMILIKMLWLRLKYTDEEIEEMSGWATEMKLKSNEPVVVTLPCFE